MVPCGVRSDTGLVGGVFGQGLQWDVGTHIERPELNNNDIFREIWHIGRNGEWVMGLSGFLKAWEMWH